MIRPALLAIDLQNDFLDTWSAASRASLLRATNQLVDLMRAHSCPVIWVRQEFEPDLSDAFLAMKAGRISIAIRGTAGAEIAPQLRMSPSDIVLVKKRYSAFFRTNLDELLNAMRVDTIVLAGLNTHACIRATAVDAYRRDWQVIIASDCVGSYDADHHAITLRYLQREIARSMADTEIDRELKQYSLSASH